MLGNAEFIVGEPMCSRSTTGMVRQVLSRIAHPPYTHTNLTNLIPLPTGGFIFTNHHLDRIADPQRYVFQLLEKFPGRFVWKKHQSVSIDQMGHANLRQ